MQKGAIAVADYREISQQYAKEGIRTIILLNGGAAVALLSQAGHLVEQGLVGGVRAAMIWWSAGAGVGAVTWILAFASTRYVDKSERETASQHRHLKTSDWLMLAGLICVALALICFGAGAATLAHGFAIGS